MLAVVMTAEQSRLAAGYALPAGPETTGATLILQDKSQYKEG